MDSAVSVATSALRVAIQLVIYESKLTVPRHWPEEIIHKVPDNFTSNELTRQFESSIDRIALQLLLLHAGGSISANKTSYDKALRALGRVLSSSPNNLISLTDLKEKSPSEITAAILPKVELLWESGEVSGTAQVYGMHVLDICSYLLRAWVRILPSDRLETVWTRFAFESRLVNSTTEALEEARRAGIGIGNGPNSRIIGAQRRDLSDALGRIELFGLPLEPHYRWVGLSISYLSCRVGATATRIRNRESPLDALVEHHLERPSTKHGMRLLLVGKAGSGKTTAAQWIAYQSAQREFSNSRLPHTEQLPLFVRLREAIRARVMPHDRALLYTERLQDVASPDWLETCAPDVVPLVVFDGWDELSPTRRTIASQWVKSLSMRFPSAHLVITSRPETADDDLFSELDFLRVEVLPLRMQDAVELVNRWFRGLVERSFTNRSLDLGFLDDAQRDLLRDLKNPALVDMIDTPLLTAMLCALYVTQHTNAPDTRGQLFERVVHALAHDREQAKEIRVASWNEFSFVEKEKILRETAYAMSELGTLQIPIKGQREDGAARLSLTDVVTRLLPRIGRSESQAAEVVEALLQRSVVLQSVSEDEAEFAHRSIHEYLAASHYRIANDLESLLTQAIRDQWGLLAFACYRAPEEFSDRIIEWLLAKLEMASGATSRREFVFRIVECVASASSVGEGVRPAVERAMSDVFPPRNTDESRSLATLGPPAVKLLRQNAPVRGSRALVIDALARIGTQEAQECLSLYAAETLEEEDARALVSAWPRFDASRYAEEVLAELKPALTLRINDESRLTAAALLTTVQSLNIEDMDLSDVDLTVLQGAGSIENLGIKRGRAILSFDWTLLLRGTKHLWMDDAEASSSGHVGEFGPSGLWTLSLRSVVFEKVNWTRLLGRLNCLRVLQLIDVVSSTSSNQRGHEVVSGPALSGLRSLVTLAVMGRNTIDALDFLSSLPSLRRLELGWQLDEGEVSQIADGCPRLRYLDVSIDRVAARHTIDLIRLRELRTLRVAGAQEEFVAQLPSFSKLVNLTLARCDLGRLDLVPLPKTTRSLSLVDCTFRQSIAPSDGTIDSWPEIRSFSWQGGGLEDLTILTRMPNLSSITIIDDGSLRSIEHLGDVPTNCRVRLVGVAANVADEVVECLSDEQLDQYEPGPDRSFGSWYVDYGGS